MKFNAFSNLSALFIAAALASSGCAVGDGNGLADDKKTEAKAVFTLDASLVAEASAIKENGHYTAASNAEVELKSLTLHVSNVKLVSKTAEGGEDVEFDPENPPEPYENCHAGHCHIKGSSDIKSFEEIKAELSKGTLKSATSLDLAVDKTVTIDAFNKVQRLEGFAEGNLSVGNINEVQLTFDKLSLEAVNVTANKNISLKNEHKHGDEVHSEPLVLKHPIELIVTKDSKDRKEIHMVLEIGHKALDEIVAATGEIEFADIVGENASLEIEGEHDHQDHDHQDHDH